MRLVVLLVVAACTRPPPTVSVAAGGRGIAPGTGEVFAAAGAGVRISTFWGDICGGREAIDALGISPREPEPCHEVRHRVHLRCAEPCEILASGNRVARDELRTAPTTIDQRFQITTRAPTLTLSLVLDAGRDRRTIPVPRIRFVVPTELLLECGRDGRYTACERELPADPELVVRVREPHGLPLSSSLVGYGRGDHVPLRRVLSLPPGPDGRTAVEPGDYPIVVEAHVGEHVLRRELTLRLR
jgi:hypothetical protein